MKNNSIFSTKNLVSIAMLSAVACLLMFFEFNLPFLPAFYKLDFSEVAVLIGGFALGPLSAVIIEVFKVLLLLLFRPTSTMFVGELANIVIGCAFVVPAALVYQKHKTKNAAMLGMLIGGINMCIIGALVNAFVMLPFFAYLYGMQISDLVAMGSALNGNVTGIFSFVILMTTPLNLIKAMIDFILTNLLYKRISVLLKRTS